MGGGLPTTLPSPAPPHAPSSIIPAKTAIHKTTLPQCPHHSYPPTSPSPRCKIGGFFSTKPSTLMRGPSTDYMPSVERPAPQPLPAPLADCLAPSCVNTTKTLQQSCDCIARAVLPLQSSAHIHKPLAPLGGFWPHLVLTLPPRPAVVSHLPSLAAPRFLARPARYEADDPSILALSNYQPRFLKYLI